MTTEKERKKENSLLQEFKSEMKKTDLSLRQLAKKTKCSPAWFSRIMTGDLLNPGVLGLERAIAVLREENNK